MNTKALNIHTRVEQSIFISQFSGKFLKPHLPATIIITIIHNAMIAKSTMQISKLQKTNRIQ